jgi:hypothetical protein
VLGQGGVSWGAGGRERERAVAGTGRKLAGREVCWEAMVSEERGPGGVHELGQEVEGIDLRRS